MIAVADITFGFKGFFIDHVFFVMLVICTVFAILRNGLFQKLPTFPRFFQIGRRGLGVILF